MYNTQQTVFDMKDFQRLFGEQNYNNLKSKISYYVKRGYIDRIRRGFFVKKDFDVLELACKIYTPSYISFETVLQQQNIIFQYDETIYLASYLSRDIQIKHKEKTINICYRKIKGDILLDQEGLIKKKYYTIASKDRAIKDMLYLKPDFYFDNLPDGYKNT
ncbi:MAG TPA: hypothetical protein P5060_03965 [Candidatus Absconditabacterales bacterium]|nr:hypothetical protein [Candidatus Absconditabacterales bacterium]